VHRSSPVHQRDGRLHACPHGFLRVAAYANCRVTAAKEKGCAGSAAELSGAFADPSEHVVKVSIPPRIGRVPLIAGPGALPHGGQRADQEHDSDRKSSVHLGLLCRSLTKSRDAWLRRVVIPQSPGWSQTSSEKQRLPAIKCETSPLASSAHAPADKHKQVAVLVPQAPGDEIAFAIVVTVAPLSYSLAQVTAPFVVVPIVPVAPFPHSLAQRGALLQAAINKVPDKVSQIPPRLDPVPQQVTHIAI